MPKRWRIHSHEPERIAYLQQAASVPAVVAQLLLCRGICEPAEATTFLDPKLTDLRDPDLLPGCPEAADKLYDAAGAGRRIVVYGDYDVDGMTGTAILLECLKLLGANVGYYVPNRLDEGYGMNSDAVRSLAAEKCDVLVTVDCGIGSVAEARVCRENGMVLIITDHHEPGPALPEADAIVHPALSGGDYPFAGLSGSGVALKLAWAVCQRAAYAVQQFVRCFCQAEGFLFYQESEVLLQPVLVKKLFILLGHNGIEGGNDGRGVEYGRFYGHGRTGADADIGVTQQVARKKDLVT